MGLFRQVRRHHKIRVDGPATITVIEGRASVEVTAENTVKIDHDKPQPRKSAKRACHKSLREKD